MKKNSKLTVAVLVVFGMMTVGTIIGVILEKNEPRVNNETESIPITNLIDAASGSASDATPEESVVPDETVEPQERKTSEKMKKADQTDAAKKIDQTSDKKNQTDKKNSQNSSEKRSEKTKKDSRKKNEKMGNREDSSSQASDSKISENQSEVKKTMIPDVTNVPKDDKREDDKSLIEKDATGEDNEISFSMFE